MSLETTVKTTIEITIGMRVKHKLLGEGLVVKAPKDAYSMCDYDKFQIATVMFDHLPEGYSNPFICDWSKLTPIK
jgi:hypothetical protein